ncbi:MAG: AbrB/MazE/SpoVT family DNA-binding domain-containing protein [Thermodesulfovibrionales bacterium]|jgi:AbrB family looped-hinge helix DNA binding protein|nr:AbrB/MazE/SpoVT family DNA-binding domain-containing protein [Thermodesulfovibrionales bacterium]
MKTTIDRFGRIVVPKDMRKRFGLTPGAQVEIEEQDKEIVIRQVAEKPPLRVENGLLVFDGEAIGDITLWVSKVREDRNMKVSAGA